MQIKKIFLYNVPYTEDDHHQPLHSELPDKWTPIKEFNDIKTHLFNFGTSVELIAFYDEIRNANYAKFIILMNSDITHKDPWEITYYAWIDKIDLKSQQYNGSTKILYHWDYWRTFIDNISVSRGTIISRSSSLTDPPQIVPCINEIYDTTIHYIVGQRDEIVWIYMTTIDPDNRSGIQRIAFPVSSESYNMRIKVNSSKDITRYYEAPSFREVIDGTFLTSMGIEQNKLVGCSISSISPVYYEIDLSQDTPKITVNYHTTAGYYVSIKTDDIIEEYGKVSKTYGDIHRIDFGKFRELPFNIGFDLIEGKDELKWWCFPRSTGYIDYQDLISFKATVVLEPPDENKQYFPFLIYLKYYTSYYRIYSLIIRFSDSEVYYGSYEWKYKQQLGFAPSFIQEFHVDSSRYIIEIIKKSSDKFTVKFNTGDSLDNVEIDKILVKRKKKGEDFRFFAIPEDTGVIESKLFKNDTIIVLSNIDGIWSYRHYTFDTPLSSTPLNNLYLLDNAGYPITKFQQGRDLLSYTAQAVSQNNEMFVLFRFNNGGYVDNNEFVVNMTPIDLTQGYFNEYIVSGEREAANARRNENIMSSLVNLAANAAIGTLIAGPGGGVVGAGKALGKTLLGGVVTTGVVGTALNQYQQSELENRLRNRGSFLLRSGNDYSWVLNGDLIRIVKTNIDSYSAEQYNNKVYEYGINCNEIDIDGTFINTLLQKGGPIKLSSVTLNEYSIIPYEANVYIRRKLLDGVFLDLSLSKPTNQTLNNIVK